MTKTVDRLIVFMRLDGTDIPVGELIKTAGEGATVPNQRRSRFRYAKSWLARASVGKLAPEIDPTSLPVVPGEYPSDPLQVHLVFYDAAPDGFGRTVLHGAYPDVPFGIMEYLAAAGVNRTGALSFGFQPESGPEVWQPADPLLPLPDEEASIEQLAEAANAIIDGEATRDHFKWLLSKGSGNVGGARPKARITDHEGDWIAKFSMTDDSFNDPRMEAVCLSLAHLCGIETSEHKIETVGKHSVLLVRRFDRHDNNREWLRYISAATLLGEDPNEYNTGFTYVDLVTRARETGVAPCEKEIFARLLFNCFIRNTDDHLRNTAFIGDAKGWRISPAYDLVPQKHDRLVMSPARGIPPLPDPVAAFKAWSHMHMEYAQACEIYEKIVEGLCNLDDLLDKHKISTRDRETTGELMKACRNPPPTPRS